MAIPTLMAAWGSIWSFRMQELNAGCAGSTLAAALMIMSLTLICDASSAISLSMVRRRIASLMSISMVT